MFKKSLIAGAVALATAAPAYADAGLSFDGWMEAQLVAAAGGSSSSGLGGQLNASYGYDLGGSEAGIGLTVEGNNTGYSEFFPFVYFQFGNTKLSYGNVVDTFTYVIPDFAWGSGALGASFFNDFDWLNRTSLGARVDTSIGNVELSASHNEYGDTGLGLMSHFGALSFFAAAEFWSSGHIYSLGFSGGNTAVSSSASMASSSMGSLGMPGFGYILAYTDVNSSSQYLSGQVSYNFSERLAATLLAEASLNGGTTLRTFAMTAQYILMTDLILKASYQSFVGSDYLSLGLRKNF